MRDKSSTLPASLASPNESAVTRCLSSRAIFPLTRTSSSRWVPPELGSSSGHFLLVLLVLGAERTQVPCVDFVVPASQREPKNRSESWNCGPASCPSVQNEPRGRSSLWKDPLRFHRSGTVLGERSKGQSRTVETLLYFTQRHNKTFIMGTNHKRPDQIMQNQHAALARASTSRFRSSGVGKLKQTKQVASAVQISPGVIQGRKGQKD